MKLQRNNDASYLFIINYFSSSSFFLCNGKNMERVNISFDEEHNIRLLEPDKYTDSERLQKESSAFVTSTVIFLKTFFFLCIPLFFFYVFLFFFCGLALDRSTRFFNNSANFGWIIIFSCNKDWSTEIEGIIIFRLICFYLFYHLNFFLSSKFCLLISLYQII